MVGLHAETLRRIGKLEEAEALYARAKRDDSDAFWADNGLAFCAYGRGDLDEAIRIVEAALSDSNLTVGARRSLTYGWDGLGYRAFLADAGRVLEAGDAELEWFRGAVFLVEELLYAGQPVTALARLIELMDRKTNDDLRKTTNLMVSGLQIRLRAAIGDLERADASYQRLVDAVNADRNLPRGFIQRNLHVGAELALAQGDGTESLRLLNELFEEGFIRGGTDEVTVYEAQARAYEMTGKLDRAIVTLEELTRVFGGRTLAHFQLGKLYEQVGRVDEARARYELCLELWHAADDGYPYPDMVRERLSTLGH
jgi:tetratricopeptide (TPR) repeat protein